MDFEEYKNIYKNNMIIDQTLTKNDYIFKYVELGDERYLSGAIYNFWYILYNKLYKNKNNSYISPEEIYNLYIDAILQTCEKALWKNPSSNLYLDEKAPEKSINTVLTSSLLNKYYENTRQKRVINHNTLEYKNNNLEDFTTPSQKDLELDKIIVDFFNKKDYYSAYILDLITNDNVFDEEKAVFNKKKLKHLLMSLNDVYYKYFSSYYNIDLDKVLFSKKYMINSYSDMSKKINKTLKTLFKNLKIRQLVKEGD